MFRPRTIKERFWEILPGLELWIVLLGAVTLSYYKPVYAGLLIICFDFYWLLRAINGSSHLISSFFKFKVFVKIDWLDYASRLKEPENFIDFLSEKIPLNKTEAKYIKLEIPRLRNLLKKRRQIPPYEDYYHLVLVPFVDEGFEILDACVASIANCRYPKDKLILLLASEERAGQQAQIIGRQLRTKYENRFYRIFLTTHPDGLPDEIKGKSANATFAIEQLLPELQKLNIEIEKVLISNFDSDTIIHPLYFARVIYEFLTAEKPYQCSFQPIAVYNNNIWDSPALIRVITLSSWQFTESSRPDRLITFSSHTMTLKTLIDVGFWKKDIVNEDGYIYWQCFLHFNGDYQVVPLFLPVSLDTCLAETAWQTFINQYKQRRRWAYNVEYYPHLIWPLIKSKTPLYKKLYKLYQYMEGNFTWATASIIIAFLGWLPLIIGGQEFLKSVVALNLPLVTKTLMRVALIFLIFSVYVNMVILPPRPKKYGPWKTISMYLQWFLVPISAIIFHSLPAIDAQTRLMLGKYLEFWVTPKTRKGKVTGLKMNEMQTAQTANSK